VRAASKKEQFGPTRGVPPVFHRPFRSAGLSCAGGSHRSISDNHGSPTSRTRSVRTPAAAPRRAATDNSRLPARRGRIIFLPQADAWRSRRTGADRRRQGCPTKPRIDYGEFRGNRPAVGTRRFDPTRVRMLDSARAAVRDDLVVLGKYGGEGGIDSAPAGLAPSGRLRRPDRLKPIGRTQPIRSHAGSNCWSGKDRCQG